MGNAKGEPEARWMPYADPVAHKFKKRQEVQIYDDDDRKQETFGKWLPGTIEELDQEVDWDREDNTWRPVYKVKWDGYLGCTDDKLITEDKIRKFGEITNDKDGK